MSDRGKALVDRAAVAAFVIAWTVLLVRIGPAISSPDVLLGGGWLAALAGLLCGYLLADLLAGAVHWIADRFFDPRTPLLGPLLIAPFREHHDDPLGITRHDFYEVSGNNALVTLPVVIGLATLEPPADASAQFFAMTGASLTLALFATNLFHRWAHMPSPPRLARRLHDWGLVLTPRQHALHHREAHDRAYCVTSGWMNPLLDRLRLFERLEHAIGATLGRKRRTT